MRVRHEVCAEDHMQCDQNAVHVRTESSEDKHRVVGLEDLHMKNISNILKFFPTPLHHFSPV